MTRPSHDDDTPIWGGKNIAPELNRTVRQTYHLLESGALGDAVSKVGNQHVTTRRKLREKIFGREQK